MYVIQLAQINFTYRTIYKVSTKGRYHIKVFDALLNMSVCSRIKLIHLFKQPPLLLTCDIQQQHQDFTFCWPMGLTGPG